MRIAIIGYSGAGKSTLARALGERYACPVLHLDALHFLPGWKERGDGDALSLLLPRLQEKSWVIDGNYGSLAYWERMELADQIIFFQFQPVPMPLASLWPVPAQPGAGPGLHGPRLYGKI